VSGLSSTPATISLQPSVLPLGSRVTKSVMAEVLMPHRERLVEELSPFCRQTKRNPSYITAVWSHPPAVTACPARVLSYQQQCCCGLKKTALFPRLTSTTAKVAVIKLNSSRSRRDFKISTPPFRAALSQLYSVACFATLRFLS
jgi:hypothetical protein